MQGPVPNRGAPLDCHLQGVTFLGADTGKGQRDKAEGGGGVLGDQGHCTATHTPGAHRTRNTTSRLQRPQLRPGIFSHLLCRPRGMSSHVKKFWNYRRPPNASVMVFGTAVDRNDRGCLSFRHECSDVGVGGARVLAAGHVPPSPRRRSPTRSGHVHVYRELDWG